MISDILAKQYIVIAMQDQYLLYLYFFLISFITIFLYKWFSNTKTALKNLPPSPPKLPIIGNLHQLGQDPHIILKSLAQRYGPLMLLKFGSVPVLVVSSADAAREIIKTNDLVFSDRPTSSVTDKLFYNGRDVGFARYSEYLRRVKSTCVTHLLSSKRVHSFLSVREEEVDLLIRNIQNSDLKTINLSDMFSELTNNVVCRVSLGRKYNDKGNSCNRSVGKVMELLGSHSIGDYIPLLCWVDLFTGLKGKVEQVAKEVDAFLEGVLGEHESTVASGGGCGNGNFISILLDVQKQNTDNDFYIDNDCIKAVILDMFAAGTKTTSTTLEWTIAALIKSPDAMYKLQKEVREIGKGKSKISEGDLKNMHYLKAVMKESMRLNFTLPLLVPREARKDVNVMGYDISSGTQVFINAWAIARDPSLWNNPEEFRPERFLDSPIDYKGVHYEFLPFGGGRRMCPGIQFAVAVNELAIANIVHKFNFELPDGQRLEDLDMTGVTGLSVSRKSPLLVIAKPHV